MPRNVVVDSSVLVSAFLTRSGATAEVLDRAREGAYVLCLSPIILEEVRRALLRPKLLAAGADLIVTGDEDLLVLKQYEAINIVTVKSFLESLEKNFQS